MILQKKCVSIRQKEGFKNAQQLVSTDLGKNLMQEIRILTNNFISNENKLLSERLIDTKEKFSSAIKIIIGSIILTIIIVLTTMFFFLLGYNKRIRSQRDYQNFMDLSIDLVMIANVNGLFHKVNPALTQLLGYAKEEIEGTPFIDYIHPDDFEKTFKEVDKLAQGELTLSFENRYRKKNGEYVLLSWKASPDVQTGQLYCVARDITLEKIKEEELINARNIAEQSVAVKEQFLANMSHEIRTPMNGIIGFASILEDSELDSNQKQSARAIKKAGENLMIIINDILDFSKIEAGQMTFENANFSLSETVESVIELLAIKAREQQINLFFEIEPKISNHLCGDSMRLSQILFNLLGNAIKFTLKGSVSLHISILTENETDITLYFQIKDTGIGIPNDKLDSIFESFNQASNETTRKFGGTGLGLTITRRLIELQGGTMAVKSEVSKGSEFSFSIQYKKAKLAEAVIKEDESKTLTPEFLQDLKILLVEDHELNQLLATKVFQKWGKEIDIADNGKIAIGMIDKNEYDIILMDIQMPEMDGYDTTRFIRANMGEKSRIPIIALSAHASKSESKKCLEIGMDDYMSKPFDSYELLKKIHSIITKSETYKSVSEPKKYVSCEKVISLENLNEFADGDEVFIEEIISLFLTKTPIAIETILDSEKKNDFIRIKQEVHKLKSSLGLFGIIKATESVEIIENEIENNQFGDPLRTEIKNLISICEEAMVELKINNNSKK